MAHNYRTAKKGEPMCEVCHFSQIRPTSGRLECPIQSAYQVGKKSTCDAFKGRT